jgi:hypothetical protein
MAESEHESRRQPEGQEPTEPRASEREIRPEPERQGPDRTSQLFRDRLGTTARTRTGSRGGESVGDGRTVDQVIADAVGTAYGVIEDNIRHGRHAAERLRHGTYQSADLPDDLSQVVNRLLTLGMDLSMIWFRLMAAVLRDPRLAAAFEGAGGSRPAARRTTMRRPPRIVYQVHSSRPHEVDFNPHAPTRPTIPASADLYHGEGRASPIRGVRFESGGEGVLRIVITVPDHQPSGTYSGAVIDRDTHEPIGTLRLTIHP